MSERKLLTFKSFYLRDFVAAKPDFLKISKLAKALDSLDLIRPQIQLFE